MSINVIPVVGWFLSFIGNVSLAIPFWFVWKVCGIGQTYFYFLPERYLTMGFWGTVGVFIVLGILRGFSPFVVSNNSSSKAD